MSEDVYVVGSGPSLDFIDPEFFRGKKVIAVNNAAERLGLFDIADGLVSFTHYHADAVRIADEFGGFVVAPEGDRGFAGKPDPANLRPGLIHYFPHVPTEFDFYPERATVDDSIMVGSTSAHGAIHLAAAVADTVILVGMDCGRIDGKANAGDYRSGDLVNNDEAYWLDRWNTHLEWVKAYLEARYDVRIYSLNPFVNLNLEGHTWEGTRPWT